MSNPFRHGLLRGGIVLAMVAMLLAAFTSLAAAAPGGHGQDGGTRPGWGCGDTNHVHTGPPGLGSGAVSPCGNRGGESSGPPSAVTHLAVSAPASVTAGTAFSFSVTALNGDNQPITSFGDTIHFTSSDGSATLPADSGLSNGAGTFLATLRTVGTQTITASDTANGSIAGVSGSISVSTNPAPHFVVTAPSRATAGSGFNFTVTAVDQNSNTITSFGDTVHFTSSDGAAVLPGDSTLSSGAGTFSATLKTAGNQFLTATDTANSSMTGVSSMIAVSAAAATHVAVTAPASATAGTAFNFTVTAQDQFNNTATSYGGTLHFTSSDGAAALPANSTLTNGTGTFSATLHTAGNQTIAATDTVTGSITGTSGTITVS